MKIQLFNGGLNIRLDPTLIQSNEAVDIENVDTSTGVIKASKDVTATVIESTDPNVPFFYNAEDEWQNRLAVTSYLEYQGNLYWTTDTFSYKYDGTDIELLGIVAPDTAPTTVVTNLAEPGSPEPITIAHVTHTFSLVLGTAAGSGPAGAHVQTIVAYRDSIAFDSSQKTQILTGAESLTSTLTSTAGTPYAVDTAIYKSTLLEFGDYLYLLGGFEGAITDKIYVAHKTDPTNWSDSGDVLPGGLYNSQGIVLGDTAYLFGGTDGSGVTDKIYSALLETPTTWFDTGDALVVALQDSHLLQVATKLYLFGGEDGSGLTDKIYSADVATPTVWSLESNTLPSVLAESQVVIAGSNIYLLGGNDGSETDKIFTAEVNVPTVWTDTGSTLPVVLSKSQVITFNTNLYLLGGLANSSIYTATVSTPENWTDTLSVLPDTLYDSQAIVLGVHAYLFGGFISAASTDLYRVHISTPIDWVDDQKAVRIYTSSVTDAITAYTPASTARTLDRAAPVGIKIETGEEVIIGVSTVLGSRVSEPVDTTITKEEDKIIRVTAVLITNSQLAYYVKLGEKYYEFYRGIKTTVHYPAKLNLTFADLWVMGGLDGVYQYGYTYFNNNDGTESALSPISIEIIPLNDSVTLTNLIPSSDPQVTHYIIYRIGNTLLKFTEITSLAISETSFEDTKEDSLIIGGTFFAILNGAPLSGLNFLVGIYGVFVGALGSKFYFTRDIGNPNYWPANYYIDFDEAITGIGISSDGIIAFTRYIAFVISGTSANTFLKYPLSGDQGCINHNTIAKIGGSLLFVSTDGICIQSSGEVKVISKGLLGKITLSTVNAVIHDEVYYIQLTDGRILAYDFRYEPSIKYFDFSTNYLVVANDTLYGRKADNLLHTLFTGSAISFRYKTGQLTDGLLSDRKEYNKIYIYSSGTNFVTIFIDDVEALTAQALTEGINELAVPQINSIASKIQFLFTGTGTVFEIDYAAQGRLNREIQ